jgi:hypothetical protein
VRPQPWLAVSRSQSKKSRSSGPNRSGEAVVVSLREYEAGLFVDVRRFYTAGDGRLTPTPRGLALAVRRLPSLAAAINKALARAHELGLIESVP